MIVAKIKEGANSSVRKINWTPAEVHAWLDPILDEGERARLSAFFAEAG